MTRTAFALLLIALSACSPKLIPGTEIQDTEDTRALLLIMEKFRSALENKDVKALVALTAPTFRDQSGTPDPDDDLDAAHLESQLTNRLAKIQDIHVEIDVRKIDVEEKEARIIYYYTVTFRPKVAGAKAERDADLKQMVLVREGKGADWKINTGI
jgi:hypothetical protein